MAQGNMLLGMARGSVGDVTFARSVRKQVSRARNRKPNNPRTLAQIRQRIFLKSAALAYSVLAKDFADQTFEGSSDPRENQQRFMKVNISLLKANASSENWGFAAKGDVKAPNDAWCVSEGTLDSSRLVNQTGSFRIIKLGTTRTIEVGDCTIATTWREFCAMVGLPAGAQVTFISVIPTEDKSKIASVLRSRFVFADNDGNVDTPMFSAVGDMTMTLNNPSDKNEGHYTLGLSGDTDILFLPGEVGVNTSYNAAVVSSFDKKWRYSTAYLIKRSQDPQAANNFDEAVASWQKDGAASEEYTRQAE